MWWLLQKVRTDYFWRKGKLLFLFCKDTQLLIVLFWCTILPILPFPLSFGGIWRMKNLTDANEMWVSSKTNYFQSRQTHESRTRVFSSLPSVLVIKFRAQLRAAKRKSQTTTFLSEVFTPSNQLRIWHFPVSANLINLKLPWSFSCSLTVRNALQL